MPYSKRQIARILNAGGAPIIDAGATVPLSLRVTESYLRRKLYRWEDRLVGQQWDTFDAALRTLRSTGLQLADAMGISKLERTARVLDWRAAMDDLLTRTIRQVVERTAADTFRFSLTAWYAGYYGRAWLLDMVTPASVAINIPTPPQQEAHKDVLLPQLREAFDPDATLYRLMGREWRGLFGSEADEMIVKMRRALDTSIAENESMDLAFGRLREAMGLQTNRRAGFTKNFYRLQTISRTYLMESANEGSLALYRRNADIVPKVEFLAAHDGRVCALCRGLDGTRWPLGDAAIRVPPRDTHPNCRCTLIPVVGREMALEADPALRFDEWLVAFGLGYVFGDFMDQPLAA